MSEEEIKKHYTTATHASTQPSTTLNRKYVHRPEIQRKNMIESLAKCQAENLRRRQELAEKINHERLMAMKQRKSQRGFVSPASQADSQSQAIETSSKSSMSTDSWPELSAKSSAEKLRDDAVKKALRSVATMETKDEKRRIKSEKRAGRKHTKRIILAFACAAAVVVCIVSFVAMNVPTTMAYMLSVQSGIENAYPGYVPREAELVTYSAGDGVASITFSIDGKNYIISEEKSTWDSKTLLTNYVDLNFNSYDTIKEQGLTIYISGSNAAWVNGGIKYIITGDRGALTQKQITKIATSF